MLTKAECDQSYSQSCAHNQYYYYLLLMQGGGQEKKKFVVPSKDQLVEQIKALSDQIEQVSLNLIKCDFQAIEKDVEKAFPEFNLIKVKKYNPGSFQVIFESKIDAINFIRTSFDKKILTRRFFIKMGRQQKEHAENWTAVGYVPKSFKQGPKRNIKYDKEAKKEEGILQGQKVQQPKEQNKRQGNVQQKESQHKAEHNIQNKPQHNIQHKTQLKHEHKPQVKIQKKIEPKVQHKQQPKLQYKVQHKAIQHTKPVEHKVIPKIQHKPKTTGKPVQAAHKVENKQHKKDQKIFDKKENKGEEKRETKDQQKKIEDDEWIVVPSKKGKSKK